jgi:hypothetical protein
VGIDPETGHDTRQLLDKVLAKRWKRVVDLLSSFPNGSRYIVGRKRGTGTTHQFINVGRELVRALISNLLAV